VPVNATGRALALVALAATALAGCASDSGTSARGSAGTGAAADGADDLPFRMTRAGRSSTVNVRVGVLPLGAVPYDNLSLPLVSPDGRFVATQSGAPPTWPTLQAEPGAIVPIATRVEIYRLEPGSPPAFVAGVAEPVVLGRGCDANGFLVEAPRDDGSRWIGAVSWESGALTWLVADEHVNAFASPGPGGRLAWSRRAAGTDHFELVARGGGAEWSMGARGEQWVMPAWSGIDDGLFVLVLREGNLDALHGRGSSQSLYRQSFQRINLARNAALDTAFQTLGGQVTALGAAPVDRERLVFTDPVSGRAALWHPLATGPKEVLLHEDSYFAAVDGDFALVTTDTDLLRQSLENPLARQKLLAGTLIARPTSSPEWPFVLLAPAEGRVGLTALKMLPPEEAVGPPG
jgi:hypothetical protein